MMTLFKDPVFTSTLEKVFDIPSKFVFPESKIKKDGDNYLLFLPVPGLTKDDLKITIQEGTLKINYEKNENSLFVETFTKVYKLPENSIENEIEGKVENGVLKLSIPIGKKKSLEKLVALS